MASENDKWQAEKARHKRKRSMSDADLAEALKSYRLASEGLWVCYRDGQPMYWKTEKTLALAK